MARHERWLLDGLLVWSVVFDKLAALYQLVQALLVMRRCDVVLLATDNDYSPILCERLPLEAPR